MTKEDTLTIRLSADLKAKLRRWAEAEHRSSSNLIELILLDYAKRREASEGRTEETKRKGTGAARHA
jgi:predicted transcriptional regulator